MINLIKIVRHGDYVLNLKDDGFLEAGLIGIITGIYRRNGQRVQDVVVMWENDTKTRINFRHVKHFGNKRPTAIL